MPTYAKDIGDGQVEIKELDTIPEGAVTKRVEPWSLLLGCPCEHIKIVDGKAQMKTQAEKDLADKTEPRFAKLKTEAKEQIDAKTVSIIQAGLYSASVISDETTAGDSLKTDVDDATEISEVNTAKETNNAR